VLLSNRPQYLNLKNAYVPIAYRCNDQIKWTNVKANTILYNADSAVSHKILSFMDFKHNPVIPYYFLKQQTVDKDEEANDLK
jgi:hypothetical protein